MADIEPPPNEFSSRLTSPKQADQVVGTEMHNHNGGLLAFKVYPKAWGDGEHHAGPEQYEMPPHMNHDDYYDDDPEDHMIQKGRRLKHSINLPPMSPTIPMSPTMSSPPPKYVPSQVSMCICVHVLCSLVYVCALSLCLHACT